MTYVLPLESVDRTLVEQVGGKAANLGELMAFGVRVPAGVCLTTLAYQERSAEDEISEAAREELLGAAASLRFPLAVRSSATSEDSAEASFAGQYQTVLGVASKDELAKAVQTCWKSAATNAVASYQKDREVSSSGFAMAIVVQEMVQATVAGVLFTAHPVSNELGQCVINANYGLGESVVQGLTEPDTFVVDKASGEVLEETIGRKQTAISAADAGVAEWTPSAEEQARASLSATQLQTLVKAGGEIERSFDIPSDIEWAFDGDDLFILQARPITTVAETYYTKLLDDWADQRNLTAEPDAVWARGTPLSGLRVTPLYYSEMSPFFSDMFARLAALRGREPGARKNFRYFRGWSYVNIAFGSDLAPANPEPPGFLRRTWPDLRLALRHPRSYAFWRAASRYYALRDDVWLPGIARRRPNYPTAHVEEIRAFVEYLEVQRRDRSVLAATAVGYAEPFLSLLAQLVDRWAGGDGQDQTATLTTGLPGSQTHDENVELWRLTQLASRQAAVREAIVEGRFADLADVPDSGELLEELGRFQARHAHRGSVDRDLMQPRWGDDHDLILQQVRTMLRLGEQGDPVAAHERAAARREAAEVDVRERVRGGLFGRARWALFHWVMRATQRYWIYRDNQRHTFDHYFYELRCAYRALGERLAGEGALAKPDDVFFVGKHELYAQIDGSLTREHLQERADWRRDWWHEVSQSEPPALLQGDAPFVAEETGAQLASIEGADLIGTPGSPGKAIGPVRVVRALSELSDVRPGDVLVAPAIDPAWTPVFSVISAVVSEEGGVLSHATVLGREYGLPVVVGVAGATALQTGQLTEVDGSAGTVRILGSDLEPVSAGSEP